MEFIRNFDYMSREEKTCMYLINMRPVLNSRGLFHDCTEEYRNPSEPDKNTDVFIKFRTVKNNADKVGIVTDGVYTPMKKTSYDSRFDYYTTTVHVGETQFRYYFEVVTGRATVYFNQLGAMTELNQDYDFAINPGFKTPGWVKGAVIYQIYVDRFYNGDKSNDVVDHEYNYIGEHVNRVENWDKYPATMGVREFYGGDLEGVIQKFDYLQDLGIQCIYFNPLFVSPSNHKYDIQDYDYIDPHFGKIVEDGGDVLPEGVWDNSKATKYIKRVTSLANLEASNELFAHLVDEAHKRGIKVIIDGVFNHCGSFNKWLDRERIYENSNDFEKGAYVSADSPYKDFFQFNDMGAWPYNGTYNGWWGHDTLPKLNYEGSKKLEEYILNIGRKWVSPPYNVDGWRLDVAADLGFSAEYNHEFWRKFRNAVKEANPDAVILAEHYGDPYSWLQGDQWDTIMNYDAFMEPLTWFLTGMEKHSDSFKQEKIGNPSYFFDSMRHNMSRMGDSPVRISMNELSNHDHSRFLTRTNRTVGRTDSRGPKAAEMNVNKGVFKEAVVVQMTWPGAPTIYYGDEAGVCGWTDPDNRRTYPWGHEDKELIEFHKAVINIHKSVPALIDGSYKNLFGEYNVIAYGRFKRSSQAVTIVNNNEYEKHVDIPVWECEIPDGSIMREAIISERDTFRLDDREFTVDNGKITINMPAYSSVILVNT
ncbi:glycoside hydrolase family 13 protein [Eshraghiella crossota]|uniref:glycoside hydrolase family 13 protein n=1 Tax=Eshraghiella crossota TaxID=45851 RepID=UPI003FD7C821